jgi:DNA-binding CsgD family transcriptional regulator
MQAVNLQQSLFVGGGEFVNQMHKRSPRKRLYMAQNRQNCEPDTSAWQQRGYALQDAVRQAQAWENIGAADCYASANGYTWAAGTGRHVSAVQSINGFYVDFDRYKIPAYRDLSAAEFLDKVMADNPWLPVPTTFEDSGNGCWMFWLFTRPLSLPSKYDWLQQWQVCQDFLIRKLSAYGADPACSDVARVVRISGTVNTKTLRTAQAWETGSSYLFADLKNAINAEYRRESPCQQPATRTTYQPPRKAAAPCTVNSLQVSNLFNMYTLAHARMQDIKQLAVLRGGRLSEHRRMATWIYAVSAAHFCRSEHTLRAEVENFIGEFIAEPDKYIRAINYESTVDRFRAELQMIESGVSRSQIRERLGRDKAQYILSNRYILSQLDIDDAEQRKLKTIIGRDEKLRRHCIAERKRRRAAGVEDRRDYLARANQRQEQAQQLYKQGLSVKAIARQTGFSLSSVKIYIASVRTV